MAGKDVSIGLSTGNRRSREFETSGRKNWRPRIITGRNCVKSGAIPVGTTPAFTVFTMKKTTKGVKIRSAIKAGTGGGYGCTQCSLNHNAAKSKGVKVRSAVRGGEHILLAKQTNVPR